MFIPAFLFQTEKFYDLTGSLSYLSVLAISVFAIEKISVYQVIIAVMVGIWAIRLGSFLFARILKDGIDDRFDDIKPSFFRFLSTWTIQGLWVFLTAGAASTALVSTNIPNFESFIVQSALACGVLLWLVGFMFEVVADAQKRRFKKSPEASNGFISSGLWQYSRHPNYFGEILLWVGVALFALPAFTGWNFVMLISPVFVALLLIKVSGIPLLERKSDKKFGHLDTYQEYKKNTPVLVPKWKA
jgi:steroid 5-alpha reductase family enzyme